MADALRSPTSPPSRVSKRSGMPRGPSRARTCSIAPRPPRSAATGSTPSTLPRRRPPEACTSGTSSATRTPTSRCASSACAARRCSTRWAGTTTACRPSAACRTTTACAATRRCPYDPDFAPPYEGGDNKSSKAADQVPISRRNFIELCETPHRRGREALRGALAQARPERRLDPDLPHHLRRHDPHEPARLPAQPRARRGVPGARAHAVGHRLPLRDRAGRARGPRPAGRLPPRRLPQGRRLGRRPHRDDAPRAARGVRRARRAPRRRALPGRSSARPCARRSSTSRCPSSPTRSPSPTRARASP